MGKKAWLNVGWFLTNSCNLKQIYELKLIYGEDFVNTEDLHINKYFEKNIEKEFKEELEENNIIGGCRAASFKINGDYLL